MNHDLKIEPQLFQAVLEGRKTFEIRLNYRGYNAGDTVTLVEHVTNPDVQGAAKIWKTSWDAPLKVPTGRSIIKRIGYVSTYAQQ